MAYRKSGHWVQTPRRSRPIRFRDGVLTGITSQAPPDLRPGARPWQFYSEPRYGGDGKYHDMILPES